jgi:hypothetical protein
MSLKFIRSALLAGAIAASLLGAGIASAEDGEGDAPPADVAAAAPEPIADYADEGDLLYAEAAMVSKGALESALTTVLSNCRSGLLATKVSVVRNEIDPSSGYILMSEISEFGRTSFEKLDAAVLESCFKAMDLSAVDKTTLDKALETIITEMEALLAMP